jgi:hypothetical protein
MNRQTLNAAGKSWRQSINMSFAATTNGYLGSKWLGLLSIDFDGDTSLEQMAGRKMPVIGHVNPRHFPHALRMRERAKLPRRPPARRGRGFEHDALDWASGFGGSLGKRSANTHDSHFRLYSAEPRKSAIGSIAFSTRDAASWNAFSLALYQAAPLRPPWRVTAPLQWRRAQREPDQRCHLRSV